MKCLTILTILLLFSAFAFGQFTYKIKADSVLITNDSCTAELNLENSTKNIVGGFLYNRWNGRTEFRKLLVRIDDSTYTLGEDTLDLTGPGLTNAWKVTGNAGTNSTINFLGTTDNNGLAIKTNNLQRMSVFNDGTIHIDASNTTARPRFAFYPNGDFTSKANNDYSFDQYQFKNGIRFNNKLGILEVGITNNIDTTVTTGDTAEMASLIVNSTAPNIIRNHLFNSIISGGNIIIDSSSTGTLGAIIAGSSITVNNGGYVYATPVIGENHLIQGGLFKTFLNGFGHRIYAADCRESFITGTSHQVHYRANSNFISGFVNIDLDSSFSNIVGGGFNSYSGNSNLISGIGLISQGWASTTLGTANTNFASLPTVKASQPGNLYKYPLLSVGNSNSYNTIRSNALTVLYSGRTQINTTGHTTSLSESDVTPQAALDVVSTNSGVLLPRLTNTQRDNIISGDLHDGLLLYNKDSSKFQYYDGTNWRSIIDNNATSTTIASGTVLGNNTGSTSPAAEVKTWMVLNNYTVSNAATADFDLSNYYTIYDELKLTCHDIRPATNNVSMYVRISSDGSTYAASSGNYQYQIHYSIGASAGGIESTSATQILIGNNVGNASTNINLLDVIIRKPSQSSVQPAYRIDYDYKSNGTSFATTRTMGVRLNNQVTRGVRLLASSGNIYCNCMLSGIKY